MPSTAAFGSPELWAKFGLPGLVILALIIVLVFCIYYMTSRFEKIDERNITVQKELQENHRIERDTWRLDSKERSKGLQEALVRLADKIE